MSDAIKFYPLTHPQKSIWYTEKVYPNTSIGNIDATLRLKGNIDYTLLELAINLFIEKNDAARLRVIEEDGQPKQYISEYKHHKLKFYDFSGKDLTELYKWEEEQAKVPFQMVDSEIIHFDLIKVSENDGGFFVKTHHLISDAWTMSLVGNQVVDYYSALKNGIEIPKENNVSYIECILGEEEYEKSNRFHKDKEYWDKEFEAYTEKAILKTRNSNDINTRARRKTMLAPKKLTTKIHQYCTENKTSVFTLFLAALSMYINRVTAKEDLVLGTTTLNRSNAREKEIVGMFSNIAPIQIEINDDMDFKTFVQIVTREGMSLLRHQKYPYDLLLKEVREKHKISENIFDIILIYQNSKFAKEKHTEEYTTRWHFNGHQTESLNICINDRENEGHLIIDYNYLTHLFHAKEIDFIHQHIINLLWHALDDPTKKISSLDMLSEKEKHKVIYEFNDTNNAKCYIFDKNLNLVPISIAGELYISGENVTRRDLNIIASTKKEAVMNPFNPDEKLYSTDKTARWFPDGDIEYLDGKANKKDRQKEETQVKIVSTFTAEPISDYIKWWGNKFGHNLKIEFAGYNQVFQELLDSNSILSKNKDGINIVLVRFEDFIRNDTQTEELKLFKLDQVFEELKETISNFNNMVPLITAIFPVSTHLCLSAAVQNKINELNASFREALSEYKNIYTINFNNTQEMYSIEEVFDSIKDKEGHMPFTEEYYAAIGTEVARKICAIKKQHFKVIVLDCDNTLWKGICGEQGSSGVKIKGAYKELQEFMLQKYNEGMLLAICTKNNEKDVQRVFDKNSKMLLNKSHIVNWKINWQEKSQNLKEIANELNLGLDSFIFIDDNPIECSKMVEKCPEVLTLQLPSEEEYIPLFLKHVWAFDKVKVTMEDMQRSDMYVAEQKRKEIQETGISLDDYIKNLGLKLSMRVIKEGEIARAAQLTQRTNQFNLSTIRRTEKEVRELIQDDKTKCLVIEASDKFGDYGIIGLVILKEENDKLFIDTFLLSCRILGRRAEDAVLSGIRRYAKENDKKELKAVFVPTAKNKPIQEFIERLKWNAVEKLGKRIRYKVDISNLPEKIKHIAFYYNEMYEKNSEETGKDNKKIREQRKKDNLHNKSEANKKIALKSYDLCNTKIIEKTKHREYLLPINNFTGKKLLQLPLYEEISNEVSEYEAPRNEIETKLAKIWANVLKIKKIGINSEFFELGGDSLNAVILVSRIHKEFNVELTLIDIFKSNTIKKLAEKITSSNKSEYEQIKLVEKKDFYELSSAQKRMYILNQIEKEATGYNECQKILIEGNLDKGKLEKAFKEFIERHESLRTGFEMQDGKPVQKIYDQVEFEISHVKAKENEIEEIAESFVKVFDLSKPPLLRVKLIELEEEKHILLFDVHHIIIDGTSFGILIKEILTLYEGDQLNPLLIQYKDFANWQNQLLESEKIRKQEEYWLEHFKGEIPVLNMPTDHIRPAIQSFKGRKEYFTLEKSIVKKLKEICDKTESTLFMLLFSAFNVLLYRYSAQEDIVVGTPVAGRTHADTKDVVGMFVNTLPIRTYPKGENKFSEYLNKVKEAVLMGLENQDYQYEHLIEKLNIPRDMSRNPLFDVLFALQNIDIPEMKTENLKFIQGKLDNGKSKLDISIFATEKNNEIEFEIEYCTDLFEEETIKRLETHFLNILKDISDNPQKLIADIEILSEEEKNKILYEFNDTEADYPKDKTIHELFEEQVERTPDNVAVVFEDKQLTYSELNAKANQLARVLRDKGVKPDTIVGIMVERSLEMIIGILGILKAGGAYLPIDPEYPQERVKYMLEDSGARFLLTQKSLVEKVEFNKEIIEVDNASLYKDYSSNLKNVNRPKNLIYVIYTSGSTGKPKGVMLEHRNVNNLIEGMTRQLDLTHNDVILCHTTISFDMVIPEIWLPLTKGIKIVLANKTQRLDIRELTKAILINEVTIMQMTPSRMKLILEDVRFQEAFEKLRIIISGGEALSQPLFESLKTKYKSKIYNMYGPTETAVWSSIKDITNETKVTLGEPIANTQFYILDKKLKVQPINIPGELCIAGDGVARGYINKEDLTYEKFIRNPFMLGGKMYRTGDLVVLNTNGGIKFIGRIDNQIKLRGFRIELGEIERAILSFDKIKECVVLLKKDSDMYEFLCAYIIVFEGEVNEIRLKEFLNRKLPDYMIPKQFIQIEQMPLTENGKISRKELEKIGKKENEKIELEKSDGEVQEGVESIYKSVLNINNMGIHESFFGLGGDSLQTMKLILKIYDFFGVEINYVEVYKYPSIEGLSKLISTKLLKGYRKDVDIGTAYMLLNDKKEKNIFAFPPISGFGLAFNDMAKNINDLSFYAFNYIEDEDKIDKYLNIIKGIQKDGPYILLGFSAGADIVIDLSEKIKEEVIIILMDGFFADFSRDEIEEKVKFFIRYSISYANLDENNKFLEKVLEQRIRSYMYYMADKNKFANKINRDIYFLQSDEMTDLQVDSLKELTTGSIIKYKAYGKHFDLLTIGYIEKNAKIIEEILKEQCIKRR